MRRDIDIHPRVETILLNDESPKDEDNNFIDQQRQQSPSIDRDMVESSMFDQHLRDRKLMPQVYQGMGQMDQYVDYPTIYQEDKNMGWNGGAGKGGKVTYCQE